MSGGGEQQCIHRQVAPPHGTEVDMMGVDRLLQSMTGGGVRAGEQMEQIGQGLVSSVSG